MSQELLHLLAPCKVNLLLRVVGKRSDGYHELITWMQKLDLYDEIDLGIVSKPGISFFCDDPRLPADKSNLAFKAAAAFFAASRRAVGKGVEIRLSKKIPAAAGLGGGSSDAGTVLLGLNRIFDNEFSENQLVKLATPLGADVPFFAVEHSGVLATGIGEKMQPVKPVDNCTFILINPGFDVSTKWVFETFALTSSIEGSMMSRFRKHEVNTLSLDDMANDLELVTSKKFSEIEQMKKQLLEAGASQAMMSGSGPTVFGIFPDTTSEQVAVQDVAEELRQQYKDNVFVARSCIGA